MRGIGDVVHSTIVIDNLRDEYPNAQIDYLVESPSQPGLDGLLGINKILIFERTKFWKKLSLIYSIRKTKYDLILDFFSNPSTAIVTYLSGAKYRVGFPYRGRKYAYNIFGPEERGKYHSAQLHLETLKMIGIQNSKKILYYNINSKAISFANKYFNSVFPKDTFVIGLCPTGGWKSKKCPPKKFAEIASALIEKYQVKILILWGKSDEDDATLIHSLLGKESVIAPSTSIQEMAALIQKCNILIANDSGPMHISTAVGTPVLGLFGPTNPKMQGPFGKQHEWVHLEELDCIQCNLLYCPRNNECFSSLPINQILEKVNNLIVKNKLLGLS